jgi:hypothetical protein
MNKGLKNLVRESSKRRNNNLPMQGETEQSDIDDSRSMSLVHGPSCDPEALTSQSGPCLAEEHETSSQDSSKRGRSDGDADNADSLQGILPDTKKPSFKSKSQSFRQTSRWPTIISIAAVAGLVAYLTYWLATEQEKNMYQTRVGPAFGCVFPIHPKASIRSPFSLIYSIPLNVYQSTKV